ncbi:lipopolysaccharide-induced tumor necrosis factor-alpha factor [Sarcoptes scabiei]|nr:lipopolysaccharide-induced tumor necrosis factor-alpha factor [Sarcoptes scabiei]
MFWNRLKQNNYFLFDFFIFIFFLHYGFLFLTIGMLLQDKICRNLYNQSEHFCQHINENRFDSNRTELRNEILAYTASFQNYNFSRIFGFSNLFLDLFGPFSMLFFFFGALCFDCERSNLLRSIPLFLWSLFFGSFLDRFPSATKFIFVWLNLIEIFVIAFYALNVIFFDLNPFYLLLANLSIFITGDITSIFVGFNRFVILNTTEPNRYIRFTFFQISMIIAPSIGIFLGGHCLWFETGKKQLRNYLLNLEIALGIIIVSLLMISLINFNKPESVKRKNQETILEEDENKNIIDQDELDQNEENSSNRSKECCGFRETIKYLFNLNNVSETFQCFIKHRENQARAKIFILVTILLLYFIEFIGIDSIFLQFSQQAYQFDVQTYSNVLIFIKTVPTIILLISSYVLINRFNLSDCSLLALTFISGFISQVLIGTFPNVKIYLGAIIIGSFFGLGSIVIKTKISKLIDSDEIGKIFSVISTLESLAPPWATLIFTTIFSASIDHYPTLIFHLASFISVICLSLALFQELFVYA